MSRFLSFPKGFLWGTSTSAYQVEGGIENCDWSKFFPSGRACGHYYKYEGDFDLLKKLNQTAYRFSIEWSRIEPKPGWFDEKELRHYERVLFALKEREIKAMVTLHHFTTPLWLAKIGGWANKKTIFYFSRFAERVFDEYQDLVDFWITINEPLLYAAKVYLEGSWLEQKKDVISFFKVLKNQIAAHKEIYKIFHKARWEVKVGIAKNNQFFEPFNSQSLLDKAVSSLARYFVNERFLDKIKNYQDFIGLNYYFHNRIKFPFQKRNENKRLNDLGWEIYPEGIYYVLKELQKYERPVYITENGLADKADILRKDFIRDHLYWVHKAIEEGVDIRGYFYWSLMDNFEWEKGFEPKFGLIRIDYRTLERKFRPSANFYAKISKENALEI